MDYSDKYDGGSWTVVDYYGDTLFRAFDDFDELGALLKELNLRD